MACGHGKTIWPLKRRLDSSIILTSDLVSMKNFLKYSKKRMLAVEMETYFFVRTNDKSDRNVLMYEKMDGDTFLKSFCSNQ